MSAREAEVPTGGPPGPTHTVVTDREGLDQLIDRLRGVDRYALDTEFHRERTYWPRVALLQLAWGADDRGDAGVVLVDPLAVDPAPLAEILAGDGTMVAHAADQDLEVLERVCGRGPARLFDTQIAAGFLGKGSASLATLCQTFLGVAIAKGDRLTDWNRRPLTDSQLTYAAADVDHLLELADVIVEGLEARGRLPWAQEECDALRERPHGPPPPGRAWWKLRDARKLQGSARGVAQSVAAWRDQRARQLDQPVRSVLPDLAVQSIAHSAPRSEAALQRCRGLDGRHLRPAVIEELLGAVAEGRELPADALDVPPSEDVPRELRPAVALAAAWVGQVSREEEIESSVLATRADLAALLAGNPAARLRHGWRAAMAGEPLRRLLDGAAALAFDGRGGLSLEERSHRPLGA